MRANPFTAWVEGNIWAKAFQNAGMLEVGQDMPLMNMRGTDMNTNSRKQDSRSLTKNDMLMAKKMLASRKGTMNATRVGSCQSCGMLKNQGTRQST